MEAQKKLQLFRLAENYEKSGICCSNNHDLDVL